ncbi:hypothetical protein VFPFJ_08054 [Purpureocillium lilacinum]|uniref:Uncharacterized protein n=1 Tax=Purpureocillium lilacinum TaxID=33203 RepID=A0A179H657_PURLI|nr:hypothetical protein VFPFJ_08054 [Purpureocillium lilacinum]OAQ85665.1 hypothetical protein VFPFJ_08054 [Purpureocillium lilacinum]
MTLMSVSLHSANATRDNRSGRASERSQEGVFQFVGGAVTSPCRVCRRQAVGRRAGRRNRRLAGWMRGGTRAPHQQGPGPGRGGYDDMCHEPSRILEKTESMRECFTPQITARRGGIAQCRRHGCYFKTQCRVTWLASSRVVGGPARQQRKEAAHGLNFDLLDLLITGRPQSTERTEEAVPSAHHPPSSGQVLSLGLEPGREPWGQAAAPLLLLDRGVVVRLRGKHNTRHTRGRLWRSSWAVPAALVACGAGVRAGQGGKPRAHSWSGGCSRIVRAGKGEEPCFHESMEPPPRGRASCCRRCLLANPWGFLRSRSHQLERWKDVVVGCR